MTRTALALGVAAIVGLAVAALGHASCIVQTPAEQRARADVIFDGVALEGPTATGVQRFRVTRYRKSGGPSIVRVQTGTKRFADGSIATTSVALFVRRGQRWRIFATGNARRVLQTNVCAGSRRL
jgi:hypothetical protein